MSFSSPVHILLARLCDGLVGLSYAVLGKTDLRTHAYAYIVKWAHASSLSPHKKEEATETELEFEWRLRPMLVNKEVKFVKERLPDAIQELKQSKIGTWKSVEICDTIHVAETKTTEHARASTRLRTLCAEDQKQLFCKQVKTTWGNAPHFMSTRTVALPRSGQVPTLGILLKQTVAVETSVDASEELGTDKEILKRKKTQLEWTIPLAHSALKCFFATLEDGKVEVEVEFHPSKEWTKELREGNKVLPERYRCDWQDVCLFLIGISWVMVHRASQNKPDE